MDRSFLTKEEVVEASRKFVCIRLTSYENQKEMEFVKKLVQRPNGSVENTLFTVLSPDAEKTYVEPARGPSFAFSNSKKMAEALHEIADEFNPQEPIGPNSSLPLTANLKIGMNIASSDLMPIVVVNEADKEKRKDLISRLRNLAWNEDYIGKFVFATVVDSDDLNAIEDVDAHAKLIVVQPGEFGLTGKQIASSSDTETTALELCLQRGLSQFSPHSKSMHSHMRRGQEAGAFWETKLPVTDKMESSARNRTQSKINRRN